MNKEIKAKWVADLRSGEYVQGERFLKNDDKFCCLGVLCDIHRKETGKGEWYNTKYISSEGLESTGVPSFDIKQWAEISSFYININNGSRRYLPEINDELRFTFNQIADLIEEQL